MNNEKVVLDGDDMRRTLVRIAHEIVEKNAGAAARHRRHPPPRRVLARRAPRAARRPARAPTSRPGTSTSRSTATTSAAARSSRPSTPRTSTSRSTGTRSSSSTTSSSPAAPSAPRSRRCSTTAARRGPARRARRPRPPRAADPPRLRRQEPADLARRARQRPRRGARRRRRGRPITEPRPEASAHEASPLHRGPRPRRHRAHPRPRRVLRRGRRSRDQEGPGAARAHRRQPLLRGLDAHALLLRARGQAPLRRRRELRGRRVERREGRVAQGHRPDARRPQPRRDRHPLAAGRAPPRSSRGWTPAAVINAGDGKHEHPTQALLDVHTLRQRLGRARRPGIWIVGDVLHSRVARSNIIAFRRMGAKVTVCGPADAHPARRRGARLRGRATRWTTWARPTSSTRCACSTSAWTESLPPVAARVRRPRTRSTAAGWARARCSCTPARSTAASSSPPRSIDSPQALITAQVAAGVVVRMAVLYEVLAGAPRPPRRPRPSHETARPHDAVALGRAAAPAPTCSSAAPACSTRARGSTAPRDVLVRDGEIAELGAARQRCAPEGAEVVEGEGRHLLPGLRRPARAPARPRPGARGGPRHRHPRRRRRRLLRRARDAQHRPGGRLARRVLRSLRDAAAPRRARARRLPGLDHPRPARRGAHRDGRAARRRRARLHRRRHAGRSAGMLRKRCSTSACAAG